MKFLKGLYKDSALIDQPQSTHRDALNMVMNLDKGSISTEYGNIASTASATIDASIPKILGQDRKINGSILLPDNKFLLFYSTLYKTLNTSSSYIYLFDPEGDLMTLVFATSNNPNDQYYDVNTGHLNFSPEYPITGESRVAANGDVIVYFTDNYKNIKVDEPTNIEYIDDYNPPRTFNITRQLTNLKNGAGPNSLYLKVPGKKGTFTGKHVDYLNLFLTTKKIPQVKEHKLIKGGILETGAYYLCLAYATEEYTETNIYTVSQPVYIPKGNYLDNGVTPAVPFEHMTGAPANTQTSFAIQWQYSWRSDMPGSLDSAMYDENYPYIVPYIIKVTGNARTAYKLPLVPVEVLGTITFTGNENYAISSVENIVLDRATYLSAKTLTQLDNKLYLGNLTARKDIGFQRFAGNIKTIPVIKKMKRFDNRVFDTLNMNYGYTQIIKRDSTDGTYYQQFDDYKFISTYYNKYQLTSIYDGDTGFWTQDTEDPSLYTPATAVNRMGGYRNQYAASYLKSYRRGEVYALYISFVLNDGTETYAYHVPGRMQDDLGTWYFNSGNEAFMTERGYSPSGYAPYYTVEENDNGTPRPSSIQNFDLKEKLGDYHYNKVYDTGKEVIPNRVRTDDEYSMGYWANENETYPETPDFELYDVDSFGNATPSEFDVYVDGSRQVRHHKFPSNLNKDFAFIDLDRTNLYRVYIPTSGTPTGHVEESLLINLRTATTNWDDQVNQSAFFYETINILGFKFKNIKIPKFILKQVQGFKVYYAKRTLENKTILGQSLLHPSFFRAHGFFSTTRLNLPNKKLGPFYRYFSFYANIPDVTTLDTNATIQYNSNYIGKFYYTASNSTTDVDTYSGSPIVKFHDFTMLRKKINVSIADYISIQSMITMHQFTGMYRNSVKDETVTTTNSNGNPNISYLEAYKFFLTGQNENEEFSWVHADLGNLTSKFARANDDGTFKDFAENRGPTSFKAHVMVGARYNAYYQSSFNAYENSTGSFTNFFNPRALANVFTISNNGATYINGLNYLKVTDTDSFHGAQYLDNYAGESAIALSIKSGLPALLGYNFDDREVPHYDTYSQEGTILTAPDPTVIPESSYWPSLYRGKANIFLANLHSYKTDVFNPFDNQTLVWTGYYHPMQVSEASLTSGAVGGVLNCIEVLDYNLITELTDNITPVVSGGSIILTYDSSGSQTTPLEFECTDENGNGLLTGTTYNYSIVLTAPVDNYLSDAYLQLGAGGDGIPIETSSGDTTFFGTVTTGDEEVINLLFSLNETSYKGTVTITLSIDAPQCVDLYDSSYLEIAFQNTDSYRDVLPTYNDTNNYYGGFETGWIFGGDTFIARYGYRMTSSDFPNYYAVQNIIDDPTPFAPNATVSPGFGHQLSFPENIFKTFSTVSNPASASANAYLGAVAFMNMRVARTYGTDAWLGSTAIQGASLFTNLISLSIGSSVGNGASPDGMYSLRNFKESMSVVANTTIYSIFVESDDNLNFRHCGDFVKGISKSNSLYFDSYNAAETLFRSPLIDLTKQDNLLYEDHYSALQDVKTTVPFPKKGEIETAFPSRVIRSNVQDGRIDDNFRSFLALQYKDFSQNKGAITNLVALNGLLFIHTEKSLYKTTGKQNLQLGDATEAYIGSGDIFAQEPLELVTANEGYGGSFNKHSAIISKYGYAYVSRKEKKVFLLTEKLTEISQLGMETWFRLNIPYTLEIINEHNPYPINLDTIPYLNLDAPTGSFGFVSTYDPLFKRFIITKKELIYSDILKLLLKDYYIPNAIDYNYDPGGCLDSGYNTVNNDTIPQGTGVGIINGSALLTKPYLAPTTSGIWYDPNLGAFVFNQALAAEFETLGITNWNLYTKEITLQTTGETSIDCTTATYYLINISNDAYWFKEAGWTISFYPDNQSWVSRHSYVSPWYFYNSENFFSFESFVNAQTSSPSTFKIWKHNSTNGAQFYNFNYNYEFEFVINDSPELTKILGSVNFIADVYSKDETGQVTSSPELKDRLNTYNIQLPFTSFYIYNTYQNSGLTSFTYLNNIRKVEGNWSFNNFRDLVRYDKSGELSDNQYNISGGFNNNVQTPVKDLMFLSEGVINPNIIETSKIWYEQKKFTSKFFGVRLIGQGGNNLVNLYSANASLRKSSR